MEPYMRGQPNDLFMEGSKTNEELFQNRDLSASIGLVQVGLCVAWQKD